MKTLCTGLCSNLINPGQAGLFAASLLRLSMLMAAMLVVGSAQGQVLTIESWRKDDQIFWDKVLIPAFQRQHPDIKVQFKPEEPLAYDARLEARLSTRRAGDLIFCRPFDASVRMQAKGYLLPLKEEALQNFNPQARRAWTTDDGRLLIVCPWPMSCMGCSTTRKSCVT